MCWQSAQHFDAVGMLPVVEMEGGDDRFLFSANAGHIPPTRAVHWELAPTSLHSSYAQSRKQSAASTTLFDLNDDIRGDMFVCATSRKL